MLIDSPVGAVEESVFFVPLYLHETRKAVGFTVYLHIFQVHHITFNFKPTYSSNRDEMDRWEAGDRLSVDGSAYSLPIPIQPRPPNKRQTDRIQPIATYGCELHFPPGSETPRTPNGGLRVAAVVTNTSRPQFTSLSVI